MHFASRANDSLDKKTYKHTRTHTKSAERYVEGFFEKKSILKKSYAEEESFDKDENQQLWRYFLLIFGR